VKSPAERVCPFSRPPGPPTWETDQRVTAERRNRPELAGLPAIDQDSAIVPLNYYYSSPGPLAVDGVELIADRLAR